MSEPRSYLFVPGHRPDRFAKAANTQAHRIILDLEDAVGPDDKAAARRNAADWFAGGGQGIVRINAADTEWFADDVAALSGFTDVQVVVPKAEPATLARAAGALPDRPLIALVETVAGLVAVRDSAASPGVARLAFGNLDFATDAGISDTGLTLDPARFDLVIASRFTDLPPPIDGVTISFDEADVVADVARAKRMGFGAKLCIHPRQVEPVNRGFIPGKDEIAWARRIVAAVKESRGAAIQVDGKMVDRPMVERAKAVLRDSEAFETGGAT